MKRFVVLCLLLSPLMLKAQSSGSSAPTYLRYPEVPPFAMTTPSGKVFQNTDLKKNKPVMIILFSVDCEHCQHETKDIVQHISQFKGSQIVMVTPFGHEPMTAFYRGYGIDQHPDVITMGTDSTRRLNMFYRQRFYPGIYIYNKHHKLVFHHEGTAPTDTLLHYLHGS